VTAGLWRVARHEVFFLLSTIRRSDARRTVVDSDPPAENSQLASAAVDLHRDRTAGSRAVGQTDAGDARWQPVQSVNVRPLAPTPSVTGRIHYVSTARCSGWYCGTVLYGIVVFPQRCEVVVCVAS